MYEATDPNETWFGAERLQRLAGAPASVEARQRMEDAVDAAFDRLAARIESFLEALHDQATRLARGFRPPAANLCSWVLEQLRTHLADGDPFAPVEAALAEATGVAVAHEGLTARVVERLMAMPEVQEGARLVADAMGEVVADRASGTDAMAGPLAGSMAGAALPGLGPLLGALVSASHAGNARGGTPDPGPLRDLVRAGLLHVIARARAAMRAELALASSAAQ
ncbi:MAG: hypothetical protein ACOC3D_01370 [Pseudomonadota bacterium]